MSKASKNKESKSKDSAETPKENPESQMELWEHLDDLRSAIVRILCVVSVGTLCVFYFAEPIVLFLETPLLEVLKSSNIEAQLYYTGIGDKFFIYLKVSVVVSLALFSPYVLFEFWQFIRPALYPQERKIVVPFVLFGTLSFIAGLAFSFYMVIPASYDFLINFGSETDQAIITLKEYFALTVKLLLGIALIFELPVVLIFLGFLGIIDSQLLIRNRKYALFAIAVTSAAITPTPDAITMFLVMGPLYLLYELSILGLKFIDRPPRNA